MTVENKLAVCPDENFQNASLTCNSEASDMSLQYEAQDTLNYQATTCCDFNIHRRRYLVMTVNEGSLRSAALSVKRGL